MFYPKSVEVLSVLLLVPKKCNCKSVGWFVCLLVCHHFLKGLEVTLPCS